MITIEIEGPRGLRARRRFACNAEVLIGRDSNADIVLPSQLVSRRHLRLRQHGAGLELEDSSANGTLVQGAPLLSGSRTADIPCEIGLGPFTLTVRSAQEDAVQADAVQAAPDAGGPSHPTPGTCDSDPPQVRRRIRAALLDHLDMHDLDLQRTPAEALRPRVREALEKLCTGVPDAEATVSALLDEALGLGPLEPLLADPEVTEVMVVDPQTIFVERRGRIERTPATFTDDDAVRSVLERIVTPVGRRIDESSPQVDARLPDGSRVHAIIPPLSLRGPCITIRRFPRERLTLDALVEGGTLSPEMATFLRACVRRRKNLVISGGTGSGKTTLLNVLSAGIPAGERIITIEDAAELQLAQEHVVSLETRPDNLEGQGAVTIRDLVRSALRMRPDRIVVGECRGAEALDMLQAMNTGHDGSMTTTHARSAREAILRLEMLCLMAGLDIPVAALRQQIAASVDLVIQQQRLADGSRRIVSISEVLGVGRDGRIEVADIYQYVAQGPSATTTRFEPTGHLPSFASELTVP